VLPDNQSIGIGTKLLTQALEVIKQIGTKEVWLEVRISNYQAIKFYRKNKFIIVSVRKKFYSRPVEDAYLMKLQFS
jgi:ribosomal-protein-alanine N-acetyltransferase